MRTRPAGMRSSGSPGSWPPSAAEFRCVSFTLHSHPKTSNLFPEFGGMFMVANRAFLTSHAPARGRIGTPSARAETSPATSRPAGNRSGSAEVSVEGSPRESRRAAGGRARSAEMKRHCGRSESGCRSPVRRGTDGVPANRDWHAERRQCVRVSPDEGLLRNVGSGAGSAGGVPARHRGRGRPGSETGRWRARAGFPVRQG